jgi:GAF domain-containing protein
MSGKRIRCAVLGGGESDLYVLGELHKRRDVEIAFVYDRNPAAVALEIAEILRVPGLSRPEDIPLRLPVDCVVVGEPRDRFAAELDLMGDAQILDHDSALASLCQRTPAPRPVVEEPQAYTLDDAIAGFERLFDRKRLLKFLLDLAVETTGAANGSIMLYSPDARELYIAYATGLSERVVRNTRQKLGEGISGTVARERKGKLIRQAAVGQFYASERDRVNISSACSVPLIDGDALLGVLNVSSTRDRRELGVGDLETLEKLSRRMARVLADSLKLQEIQLRKDEMSLRQSLGELSEKAGSTAEKFALLSALVAQVTGAESVELFVSTHGGEWLVLGGSNRRLAGAPEFVRVGKSALARAYLERRTITLTEPVDPQSVALASSFVFVPLVLTEALGVAMVEFAERHCLDEFLLVKDSVALELARFVANERRERRLRSELASLAKVSEAAPALLACRTLQDLADTIVRVLADALECSRVSLRLATGPKRVRTLAHYDAEGRPDASWTEEDEERFAKLEKKGASYSLAFLDFAPDARSRPSHSVLAVPLKSGDELVGGVIAYDKNALTAVEEVAFSAHDENVIEQVMAMAWPAVRTLSAGDAASRPSYDEMLSGNAQRLARVVDAEMARADRYHQPFSLLLVRVPDMGELFAADETKALAVADEIRQGIQTRTRKSDYGCWIRRDAYAIVSLEGTRHMPFLVSRLVTYLQKDLSIAGVALTSKDVLVGVATYPGSARTADALLGAAEAALKSLSQD